MLFSLSSLFYFLVKICDCQNDKFWKILRALNIGKMSNFYHFCFLIHVYICICIIWDSRHESFAASEILPIREEGTVQRSRFAIKFHRRNQSCNKMERPRERSFVPAFEIDLKLTESSAIASREPTSYSPEYSSPSHPRWFSRWKKEESGGCITERMLSDALRVFRDLKIGSEIGFARLRGKFLSFARCTFPSRTSRRISDDPWYEKIRKIR